MDSPDTITDNNKWWLLLGEKMIVENILTLESSLTIQQAAWNTPGAYFRCHSEALFK